MPKGLGFLLRMHVGAWRSRVQGKEAKFSRTHKALEELHAAMPVEFPRRHLRPVRRRTRRAAAPSKDPLMAAARWRKSASRLKTKVAQLEEKLAKHTESKSAGGRISVEWISRVLCAAPNASGRALAAAFHLVVGSDRNLISRQKIGDIRSAFLEMWEELVYTNARDFIDSQLQERAATQHAAAPAATPQAAPDFLSLFFAHVQDGWGPAPGG